MELQAVMLLLTLLLVFATLALTKLSADLVMMAAMAFLLLSGILLPAQALVGFANTGVITLATLYVVAAGLKETGAVQWLARYLLGYPVSQQKALFRMMASTGLLSAFINNTAVVAMFIPVVQSWAQRLDIPPSKLLLPLSYATILGGTCTLLGTSTNLVVDGMLQSQVGLSLGLFDLLWVGMPVLVVGLLFLGLAGNRLLPDRGGVTQMLDSVREYGVEMEVVPLGPLVGKTITEAGLRALCYGYLVEIDRGGHVIAAAEPDRTLLAGDRLYFIGAPECANELRGFRGLRPAVSGVHKLDIKSHQRCLVEVVLGPEFVALGETVKGSRFRTRYNAAILSVSRKGRRVAGKLGDIHLQLGDTLLIEASDQFVEHYRFRRDFLLVSALNNSTPPDFRKAPRALIILALMVLLSATGLLSILEAALLAAGAMIVSGCLHSGRARRSINLPVLIVIAASFAFGSALAETGAAQWVAVELTGWGLSNPWLTLALVYLMTAILSELITNNATAVMMFPVALSVADRLEVSFMPYVIAVMFAASAAFITPFGYQTNLMVYGPGRYRFIDFVRLGAPLSALTAVVSVGIIPFVWGF